MPLAIHRSKVAIALCLVILAALLAVVLTSSGGQVRAQSGLLPPPLPMLIGGTVTIGGNEAPDGISIVSRMDAIDGDKYQSGASITSGGKYKNLKVAPPDIKYQSRQVTFHVIAVEGSATSHLDEEGLTARESFFFGAGAQIQDNFDLTFPAIPPAPANTPTHTPVPVDTPVPRTRRCRRTRRRRCRRTRRRRSRRTRRSRPRRRRRRPRRRRRRRPRRCRRRRWCRRRRRRSW